MQIELRSRLLQYTNIIHRNRSRRIEKVRKSFKPTMSTAQPQTWNSREVLSCFFKMKIARSQLIHFFILFPKFCVCIHEDIVLRYLAEGYAWEISASWRRTRLFKRDWGRWISDRKQILLPCPDSYIRYHVQYLRDSCFSSKHAVLCLEQYVLLICYEYYWILNRRRNINGYEKLWRIEKHRDMYGTCGKLRAYI